MFKRVQQLKAVAIIYALIISAPVLFAAAADCNDVATQITPQMFNAVENLFFAAHGFEPGTLVKTPSGYSKIENLCVGDWVVAVDPQGRPMHSRVLRSITFIEPQPIAINVGKGQLITNHAQLFRCAAQINWLSAKDFNCFSLLSSLDHSGHPILSVAKLPTPTKLVMLSLEYSHNFCVSAHDFVVHNFLLESIVGVISAEVAQKLAAGLVASVAYILKYRFDAQERKKQAEQLAAFHAFVIQISEPHLSKEESAAKAKLEFPECKSYCWQDPKFLEQQAPIHPVAKFVLEYIFIRFVEWLNLESRKGKDSQAFSEKIADTLTFFLGPVFEGLESGAAKVWQLITLPKQILFGSKPKERPEPCFVQPVPGFFVNIERVKSAVDRHLVEQNRCAERCVNQAKTPANATITPAETPPAGPIGCGDVAAADEAGQIGCALVPEQTPDLDGNTGCGSTEAPSRPEHIGCARTPAKNPDLDRTPGCGPANDFRLDDRLMAKTKGGDGPRNAKPKKEEREKRLEEEKKRRAENMYEFFDKFEFGKKLKDKVRKKNDQTYELIEDVPEYNLDKGDLIELDRFSQHKGDHLEVYNKEENFKFVLDLFGNNIDYKTKQGKGRTWNPKK